MELGNSDLEILSGCVSRSQTRADFWAEFIRVFDVRCMAEIGVFEGNFAAFMLERCPPIRKYYMIDPWRHLDAWNKPANKDDATFERIFETAKAKTNFAGERRILLRGMTTEVINSIPDEELDFAYIDGDHTLKGIAIDMIRVFPKVKIGGFVGGDDFTPSVWQHKARFEPSLVFPFAVYFAEAVGATIYALPRGQFCMRRTTEPHFNFVDMTGRYKDLGLRGQFAPAVVLMRTVKDRMDWLARIMKRR